MKLFVALCCFVLAQAQIPTRCDPPKQWEGKIHRVARGGSVKPENERVKVSYDETNQRLREITDSPLTPTPGKETYEVIYLYQTKKEYRINLATRKCNITTLTRPFVSVGIPPNATFNGFASFGIHAISGQSLDIQDWETSVYDNRFSVVLTTDCVPVQYTHYIPPSSTIVSTYFDINLGINDESVFTPPSECNQE